MTKTFNPHHQRIHRILVFALPIFVFLHLALLVMFGFLGIKPLVYFNFFSVILYSITLYLSFKQFTHIPAIFAFFEIAASIIISVICLGWDSGFHIWIFTQSATVFTLYKVRYIHKWALIGFSFFLLGLLLFILRDKAPLYSLSSYQLKFFYIYNHFSALTSVIAGFFYFNWSAERTESALFKEHQKSQSLLLNILPETTAERLSRGEEMIADSFENCSILFADLVGFTDLSSNMPADDLVNLLNEIFCEFDTMAEKWNLEKIKTIGDAYMVAAGVPEYQENPSKQLIGFGFDILEALEKINLLNKTKLQLRIGIHTGKAVAGVIGKKKFTYDLWGDTVNIASRMESHGIPGRIQISNEVAQQIKGYYSIENRGMIPVKGKGNLKVYLVNKPEFQ